MTEFFINEIPVGSAMDLGWLTIQAHCLRGLSISLSAKCSSLQHSNSHNAILRHMHNYALAEGEKS